MALNLYSENLQNGYIYKKLMEKIEELEEQNKQIMKSINEAGNNMKISVKDYVSIIKQLNTLASNDSLISHTEDNDVHVTPEIRQLLTDIKSRVEKLEALVNKK